MIFSRSITILFLFFSLTITAQSINYDLIEAMQNERPTKGFKTSIINYDINQFANPVNNTNDAFRELKNLGLNVMMQTAEEIQSRYPRAQIIYYTTSKGEPIKYNGVSCSIKKINENTYHLYFYYDIIFTNN